MLEEMDGFEVARQIRQRDQRLPILMLTARSAAEDRIHGLELGADDYMIKPFHLRELLLRVERMLERTTWYAAKDRPLTQSDHRRIHGRSRKAQRRRARAASCSLRPWRPTCSKL